MFKVSTSLTIKNAKIELEAGRSAILSGQTEFDLSEVKMVDSAAVALLLAWRRAAQVKDAGLEFKNLPENLRTLIGLYSVDALLGCTTQPISDADIAHH